MSPSVIQLLVLAGIALFLVLRLRNVLGTREGFEQKPPVNGQAGPASTRRDFEVIEGGVDLDIADHIDVTGKSGKALAAMAPRRIVKTAPRHPSVVASTKTKRASPPAAGAPTRALEFWLFRLIKSGFNFQRRIYWSSYANRL